MICWQGYSRVALDVEGTGGGGDGEGEGEEEIGREEKREREQKWKQPLTWFKQGVENLIQFPSPPWKDSSSLPRDSRHSVIIFNPSLKSNSGMKRLLQKILPSRTLRWTFLPVRLLGILAAQAAQHFGSLNCPSCIRYLNLLTHLPLYTQRFAFSNILIPQILPQIIFTD